MEAATRGNYVLLRPVENYPVGVFDLDSGKVVMGFKRAAMDVYGDVAVAERVDGEVGLYHVSNSISSGPVMPFEKTALPRKLEFLSASALSGDARYLAISATDHGAVWDLKARKRIVSLRGFRGGLLTNDGYLFADFPALDKTPRGIARLALTDAGNTSRVFELSEPLSFQTGDTVIVAKTKNSKSFPFDLVGISARDTRTGAVLWEKPLDRTFPNKPVGGSGDLLILRGQASSKTQIVSEGNYQESVNDTEYRVLNVRTGEVVAQFVLRANEAPTLQMMPFVTRELYGFSDVAGRTLIYSVKTGKRIATFLGTPLTINPAGTELCLRKGNTQIARYDLTSLTSTGKANFKEGIVFGTYSQDGSRLFILTADQSGYWIGTKAISPTAAATPGATKVQ
jgi:hypothetical protein